MSGPSAAPPGHVDPDAPAHRGERLGLPAEGVGSVPSTLRRAAALTVDWLLATALAFAATAPADPGYWRLPVFAVLSAVAVALFATTPGQLVVGLGVARVDVAAPVGLLRSVGRVLLVLALLPPLITDADGRGLQDRWTSTVVLRSR